ncbi:MAG: hypothetical protein JNL68_08890 [Burkholderiales bacterium]|nr:hypothetical protein [Burkholderiales bacterium]
MLAVADKILISIAAEQGTVARWHNGRLGSWHTFANDEGGWTAFEALLKSAAGVRAYVMVDAVEEDYRFETLPHARGRDRQQLVTRKLKQLYRNTPYCSAWMQGRAVGKRKDDIYLFAALTNPELLFGWVQAVARRQSPLVGIYTLPMVSVELAERLKLKAQNLLLVSQHASGLRQTILRDGKLRLSRLTRLEAASGDSRLEAYAEEIQNTRLYLHALKVMALEDHMTVALLDQDDSLRDLGQLVQKGFANTHVERLTRGDIVDRLGIAPEVLVRGRDALYLHVLGQRTPDCNLAPSGLLAHYHRYQARRAAYGASAAAALAATFWVGSNLWQRSELRLETERLRTATIVEQQKYESVTQQFPKAPTSAANLKKTVELAAHLRADARTPERALVKLSHALDESPGIFLRSVLWKSAPPDLSEVAVAGSASTGERQDHAIIEAEIRPFKGDYRSAIATIDSFVERLSQEKGVAAVKVLQLPINVSQTSVLSGNTAKETQVQAATAQFKLEILLKAEE